MSTKTNRAAISWRLRWRQSLWCLLMAVGLAACSTSPQQASMDVQQPVAVPQPDMAPAAPAMTESTLGTQWGEERESSVRSVKATRLTPDNPQVVAQMQYSDETAIRRALGRKAHRQLNVLLANGKVEWSVQNEQGKPLPIFRTRGSYLVAGRDGERYELVYVNRSNRYYEVVATVDGLDVISGQPGSVRNRGYLLHPGHTVRIDGFRMSEREVAAFRFAAKALAYANNTPAGDARNVGVIGSALFEVRMDDSPHLRIPEVEPSSGKPNPFPADPARSYAPPPQYRR